MTQPTYTRTATQGRGPAGYGRSKALRQRAQATIAHPPTSASAVSVSGLRDIIQSKSHGYKAVLLDQFGVVHDGARPYAGAAEAVRELHKVSSTAPVSTLLRGQKTSPYLPSSSSSFVIRRLKTVCP